MKQPLRLRFVMPVIVLWAASFSLQLQAQCTLGELLINISDPPVADIAGPNQLCPGATGTLSVTQSYPTYVWSTGESSQSININGPGTYIVTVTDAQGCTNVATQVVAPLQAPTPSIVQQPYACNGQITVDAGPGFTNYAWSAGGGAGQTATYAASGQYGVTVTDAQGCTGAATVNINIPTPPVTSISGANDFCEGGSVTLSANAGFSSYAWTGGGSGQTLQVSAAGVYTVTVTDAQGCTATASASVQTLPAPIPTASNAQLCPGESVAINVTNGPFSAYQWSAGSNQPSQTVNAPGAYTVTVTGANGCTGVATSNVTPLPQPNAVVVQQPYACNGEITADAGPGFSSYTWSAGGGAGQTATYAVSGAYTVTVTNAEGCSNTATVNINIPSSPVAQITGSDLFCEGESTTLVANTGLSGYLWSNGQGGQSITVSQPGTYGLTVTDAFGCTATTSISVQSLPAPTPDVSGPAVICSGESATLSATPGFSSYAWSNGQNGQSITVTQAATYTVTVTNSNGCTGTASQSLAVNPTPVPSISAQPYQCDNQLTLDAGPGFASYAWGGGGSNQTLSVTSSGNYSVTVSNAAGCTGVATFFADVPVPPFVVITGATPFCEGSSGVLSAAGTFNSYVWSNGQTTQNITITQGGAYGVTVADAFGCTAEASATVALLPAPAPTINGPASICAGASGVLSVAQNFSAYAWSVGQNTQSITVTQAGVYTVTVTGANGCTATTAQSLSVNPSPTPQISEQPYACNDELILNAGGGFTSYAWSGGLGAGQFATVSISDNYTVTVTSANGCTGTAIYTALIPDPPFVSISGAPSFCQGGSTTLTATPGFSAYVWNNGQNTQNLIVNAGGNYEVTVTDVFGCTAIAGQSVSVLANPTPNIAGPNSICAGGSATFTVPGNFTTFQWSNGQSGASITVTQAGVYTVTVTAPNGCTGTDDQTLTISTSLEPQIVEAPYDCDQQATLDAGAGFASYLWLPGNQNTQAITVNQSGVYEVTVFDNSGCSGTATVAVNIPDPPVVSISGPASLCQGVAVVLDATPGLGAYVWSNGLVGASISVNAGGVYAVTATDFFGCTATAAWTLTAQPAPVVQISGPSVICVNSSGVLSATPGLSAYQWSSGQNTAQINVSAGGVYVVTVTDANGCTATASRSVNVASGLSPEIAVAPYQCDGVFTLDAGAGFSAYVWSGGQNTAQISVAASGDYIVTVTDATGCTGTDTVSIAIPLAPQTDISGVFVFCENENTTLGAAPGYDQYLWSTGADTPAIVTGVGGVYGVTVTDAFGCTAEAAATVTVNALPVPVIAAPVAICANESALLTLSQNYTTYQWTGGANTESISVNTAGDYGVTVTDANGCTGTDAVTLSVNPNPTPAIAEAPYDCDGQITLEATPGFVGYLWSNNADTESLSVTVSGDYTVTVTDANGCTGTASAVADVPALPQVAISGATQFCPGGNTDLSATPGFATYLWSNADDTPAINVNAPGDYSVTVTDALGCTVASSVAVAEFAAPQPAIVGPATVCPDAEATLGLNGAFSAYLWSNNATTPSITLPAPFDASVTVTDANGCTGTAAASVAVSNDISISISALPYACDGTLTLDAGAGFQTYIWSDGLGNGQTASAPAPGSYSVTVSDGGGCSGTAQIDVTIPAPPVAAIVGANQLCPGASGVLTATPGLASYQWSTNAVTPDIVVNAPGDYAVTVTDALGCTAVASQNVASLPAPTPQIAGAAVICNGAPATLSVTGGAFSAISWSNAANTPSISVGAPGDYSVTVTDPNGCTAAVAATVTESNQISVAVEALPYDCNGLITLDAGAGYATYAWSAGAGQSQTATVSASGNYSVTVTDLGGCTGTAQIAVTIPTPPVVFIDGPSSICELQSATISATPGFVSYLWSTGDTTPDILVNTSAAYSVTATDALGCTASFSTAVTTVVPPLPLIVGPTNVCDGFGAITYSTDGPYQSYLWSDGSAGPTLTASAPGVYGLTVTDATGCTGFNVISLTVNPNPVPAPSQAPYACDGAITLDAGTGYATYVWSAGAGQSQTATVSASGSYSVTVTDLNGCTGAAQIDVSIPAAPVVAITGATQLCPGASGILTATPGLAGYQWSTNAATPDIAVNTPGNYTVTATDAFGCTVVASQNVASLPAPTPQITGAAVICNGSPATLSVTGGAFSAISWSNSAVTPSISVGAPGSYGVTVTDLNGCTAAAAFALSAGAPDTVVLSLLTCDPASAGISIQTLSNISGCDSVVITERTLAPPLQAAATVQSNYGGFGVSCANEDDGVANVAVSSGQPPFGFAWSNGSATSTAQGLVPGVYTVTVTDANGCTGVASVSLTAPTPLSPVVAITNPTCLTPGAIAVQSVSGGVGPYTVRLVQEIGTTTGSQAVVFDELNPGQFSIEVTDANGCEAIEQAVLLPTEVVNEFFADTLRVKPGEPVTLSPVVSITPVDIVWSSPVQLSCGNCLTPTLVPVRTTEVRLTVNGFAGCRSEALFLLIIEDGKKVFTPNVIKPGSAQDFAFTIYADQSVLRVRNLRVYDRWGNQMFERLDLSPNDPSQGWDGSFRGQAMNPGVYVWWAEIEYTDGATEIKSGDVTVVR